MFKSFITHICTYIYIYMYIYICNMYVKKVCEVFCETVCKYLYINIHRYMYICDRHMCMYVAFHGVGTWPHGLCNMKTCNLYQHKATVNQDMSCTHMSHMAHM